MGVPLTWQEWHAIAESRGQTIDRLAQENAKLRELASDLLKGFECGWPSDVCNKCERDGEGMPIHGCLLLNRASELGIEVDG